MAKRKRYWSKVVAAHGVELRLYERPGGMIWCSRVVGRKDGETIKRRISLRTKDRAEAERRARAICEEIALAELTGIEPNAPLPLGELRRLYLAHRGPYLKPARRKHVERVLELFERHLGADFPIGDFGPHQAETYFAARRSGLLVPPDPRRSTDHPKDGTLKNELETLSTVCNWATTFLVNGRPLLDANPVHRIPRHAKPREKNPARPKATRERYAALRAVADRVDDTGAFAMMLDLAWATGRRINAILHLRASDVLTTPEAMRPVLAACGYDEADADEWPAALHWRPEYDKKGYRDVSPIGEALRDALLAYMRRRGFIGDAWLFPANRDPSRSMGKLMAGYYLRRAEKLAGLPHVERGGWHMFRRGWATARKDLPTADVMRAGGWRDFRALQEAYSQPDAKTTLRVVEHGM